MHGMLSSAVVLAAFAVIAGAGGYTALWLYRASSGGPATSPGSSTLRTLGRSARSWLTPEPARSAPVPSAPVPSVPVPAEPDGEPTAAPPPAPAAVTAVPAKTITQNAHHGEFRPRVTFIEGDEPDPVDEIDAAGFSDDRIPGDRVTGAGGASGADDGSRDGDPGETPGPGEPPGARVYVLGQSRRARLP